MESSLIEIFDREVSCKYKDEQYRVRDNGAVYRLRKNPKKKRPTDENWTFGRIHRKTGYMNISSERVHRIVATAFHGIAPTDQHIVDHIDTNRQNNRPDNLRWLTKLENILLNPISLARVEYSYGSIDNFLQNPSKPIKPLEPNIEWMRTVSKEEAENTKTNLLNWAKTGSISNTGSLGDWIYRASNPQPPSAPTGQPEDNTNTVYATSSLTDGAVQLNWETPSQFPFCPNPDSPNALVTYKGQLSKGVVFSSNEYGDSKVHQSELHEEKELIVLTKTSSFIKPFGLARVFLTQGFFVHESLGSFRSLPGAKKQFTIALGMEWKGEDSIDDYI